MFQNIFLEFSRVQCNFYAAGFFHCYDGGCRNTSSFISPTFTMWPSGSSRGDSSRLTGSCSRMGIRRPSVALLLRFRVIAHGFFGV